MQSPDTVSQKGLSKDQFEQMCGWIDEHIHERIGWSELMHESGFDHLSIQSAFTKYQATTPMTWIRKRREYFKRVCHQGQSSIMLQSLLKK